MIDYRRRMISTKGVLKRSHVIGGEPIAIYRASFPDSVLLLRNVRKKPNNTLPDPVIEPETLRLSQRSSHLPTFDL
ncbi:hypothetical protein SFRURICE_011515 [Spodoptera frugiperda]|nr:hypothetical protein SFRURICE_011515 [Spodoptera frugiperda]